MKKIIGVALNMIETRAANLSDTYKKLIEEKKDFYDLLREHLDRYDAED